MCSFLPVCVRLSLHRGRGWEGEVLKQVVFVLFVLGFLKEFCPPL